LCYININNNNNNNNNRIRIKQPILIRETQFYIFEGHEISYKFQLIVNLSEGRESKLKRYTFSTVIINITAEISNLLNQLMFSNMKLQLNTVHYVDGLK
jgi:hypothetical protein